jgi:hypothetical protein
MSLRGVGGSMQERHWSEAKVYSLALEITDRLLREKIQASNGALTDEERLALSACLERVVKLSNGLGFEVPVLDIGGREDHPNPLHSLHVGVGVP